jgi:hypothetical protein
MYQNGQLTVTSSFIRHLLLSTEDPVAGMNILAGFLICVKRFFYGSKAPVGLGLLYEVSRLHSDKPRLAGLLWKSDRTVAETST